MKRRADYASEYLNQKVCIQHCPRTHTITDTDCGSTNRKTALTADETCNRPYAAYKLIRNYFKTDMDVIFETLIEVTATKYKGTNRYQQIKISIEFAKTE